MITIDGKEYNAKWVLNSLEQTADIINGDNSGRLQGTKSMYLDYVGTFFNHTAKIRRNNDCTDDEWDELYLIFANPINEHTVTFPFGQGKLKTDVYVSQIKRKFIAKRFERNVWSTEYDITFTAMESQWLAGDEITGYKGN